MSEKQRILQIKITDCGCENEHFHRKIELIYLLYGKLTVLLKNEKFEMGKGDIILINTGKKHALFSAGDVLVCQVYIDYGMITEEMNRYFVNFWCNSLVGMDEEYHKLRYILNLLVKEYKSSHGRDTFLIESMKYSLLECLTRNFAIEGVRAKKEEIYEDERVEKMLRYVDENFRENVSLNQISSDLYMSESYASRLFKKIAGINFQDYVIGVRLRCASEELLYSKKSVTEISELCGFSNPSAFNKLFKKEFKCTPTSYREKYKIEENAEEWLDRAEVEKKIDRWMEESKAEGSHEISDESREVDCSAEVCSYSFADSVCIDFDMASDLLMAEIQEQIQNMKRYLGIRYIRLGGFFHRDMFLRSQRHLELFNFAHTDRVFDFLVKNEICPIVDLTIRWKRSFRDIGKVLYDDDNALPVFSNIHDWEMVIETFVQHILFRYGEEIISKWYFTLEDSAPYHILSREQGKTDISYNDLWKITADVFDRNSCSLQFGGDLTLITDNSEGTEGRRIPDFVTAQIYPFVENDEGAEVYFNRTTDSDFLYSEIMNMRKTLMEYGFPHMPIIVTEWNTSISERNYYNDSCAKAAHILFNLLQCMNTGQMICYRHGSDFQSQYFDALKPLFGANGLVTKDGIPKPVFFSLYFLHSIYSSVCAKGDNYVVTSNQKGEYYILACNPRKFSHNYYLKQESEIEVEDLENIFEKTGTIHLRFHLSHIRNGYYQLIKQMVRSDAGNVLFEWENMGMPDSLGSRHVDYLKRICCPRISFARKEARKNVLDFSLDLKEDEVVLMHISLINPPKR